MDLTKSHFTWIICVMLCISLFTGFAVWKKTTINKASAQIGSSFYKIVQSEYLQEELEKIAELKDTQYRFLAKLKLADMALRAQDTEEALSIYQDILSDKKSDRIIRDTATYRKALASFNAGKDISDVIGDITNNNFTYSYSGKFLHGLSLAKQENFAEAAKVFGDLAQQHNTPHLLKIRAQQLSYLYN